LRPLVGFSHESEDTLVTTRFTPRSAGIVAGALAGLLAVPLPLTAHDLRPVPDAFRAAIGEPLQLRGQTSNAFPSGLAGQERHLEPWTIETDSAAVVATVDRFHAALAAGDSAAVADLLAPDVIILESGVQETREEYLGGHLHGDIAFARAVPRERGPIRAVVEGDVAWTTSTSVARGEFRGREINSAGVELMVLRRAPGGWRIAAIHWSSRTLRS
jgi:ketosteroid isomerase-like protein